MVIIYYKSWTVIVNDLIDSCDQYNNLELWWKTGSIDDIELSN